MPKRFLLRTRYIKKDPFGDSEFMDQTMDKLVFLPFTKNDMMTREGELESPK